MSDDHRIKAGGGSTIELPPLNCTGCNQCCHGPVMLHPALGDDYETYQTEQVFDGEGRVVGRKLKQAPSGRCVYLAEGCRIYDRRPALCRAFDCRVFARQFK